MSRIEILQGDCLEQLKKLEDNSVHAIITDPPYGLNTMKPQKIADVIVEWSKGNDEAQPATGKGFSGQEWDKFVPPPAVWKECLRVLKPGGHMAVFAGARTVDLMGVSLRLGGFQIKDTIAWIKGDSAIKASDVANFADKCFHSMEEKYEFTAWCRSTGVTAKEIRKAIGGTSGLASHYLSDKQQPLIPNAEQFDKMRHLFDEVPERIEELVAKTQAPSEDYTSTIKKYRGYRAGLSPGVEPIILAQKPTLEVVPINAYLHGTGVLNAKGDGVSGEQRVTKNVVLDEDVAEFIDSTRGKTRSSGVKKAGKDNSGTILFSGQATKERKSFNDEGGVSRYFNIVKYQPKVSPKERPKIEQPDGTVLQHPTVKPVALMEWLVDLLKPPVGDFVVVDPFAGSGATLEACRNLGVDVVGIEQSPEYIELIHRRLDSPVGERGVA